MNLFGACNCAAEIAGLKGENADLREALDKLTLDVGKATTITAKQVIAHFEDVKRKELLRRKEERLERSERLVLPAL